MRDRMPHARIISDAAEVRLQSKRSWCAASSIAVALVAGGCANTNKPEPKPIGTAMLDGAPLNVRDVFATQDYGAFGMASGVVGVFDRTGLCDILSAGTVPADFGFLRIDLVDTTKLDPNAYPDTGAYAAATDAPLFTALEYVRVDSHCNQLVQDRSIGGSVQLDAFDAASGASGTLAFILTGGGAVTGNFKAAPCHALEVLVAFGPRGHSPCEGGGEAP